MTIEIKKAPHGLLMAALKNFALLEQADALDDAAEAVWSQLYAGVASGDRKIAYWDWEPVIREGYHSFMRYALHQSTKQPGCLQLSVMEIRNGKMIPTSDRQYASAQEFLRDVPGKAMVTVR